MATLLSSDLAGLKLGFDELISNISPTTVPFTTSTKDEKVTTVYHQWQVDEYASVNLNNARPEGNEPVENNGGPTTVLGTYIQHMDETVKVADVADIVSKYGRKKELTYRILKKTAELKRSREAIMLSNQATDGSTNTPLMGSFVSQVHADNRIATGDATKAPTEDQILSTLETLYNEGADPSIIMVSPSYSLDIAGFAKAAGRYREIQNGTKADKTIINAVDLYVSPFGEQKVVLNRFQLPTDTNIFTPSDWTKLTMFPWTVQELAKNGRNEKVQIYGTFGLKHTNPKASAVIRQAAGTLGADGVYRF